MKLCLFLSGSSLLFTLPPTAAAAAEMECSADGTCSASHPQCGVYMAPSTLGEDTSMGIFTGIPLPAGQTVNFPEIAVPLLFREFDAHVDGYHDGVLWDRYIWEGEVMKIEPYDDTNRAASRSVFVPGVGCTVNSVMDESNIQSTHDSVYDAAGLDRTKDPGVGAYAPYIGAKTITTEERDLPAGAELFASYGDYWIPDIPGAQVTLNPQMDDAEDFLVDSFYPFIQEHEKDLDEELKQALWEFTTDDFPIYSQGMTNLPRNVPWSVIEEEIAKSLKEKDSDYEGVVRHFIRQQSIRQLDWLEENGYCQDHLIPKKSTIPQAGRGAFAFRDLPKGTVVGYAPMVHLGIHGKDVFHVKVDHPEDPHEKQDLILNYSFGSPHSTILLTPYGSQVNFINHGGKDGANVQVRWPTKELIAHKPWYLNYTPGELSDVVEKIGLSLEYVATRDIKAGEEVFLDYGDAWEAAWKEHEANWQPVPDADKYQHTTEFDMSQPLRTHMEQQKNPYPINFVTMCQESYTYNAAENKNYWVDVLRPLPQRVYCTVLMRNDEEEDDSLYTVSLKLRKGGTAIVHNVPKDNIFLYDKAFTADWHLSNAFRHEMALPDSILPDAWRNKVSGKEETEAAEAAAAA